MGCQFELHGEAEEVDQFAVLRAEQVCADDPIRGSVDEDLGGRGGLTDAVVGVPAAGVAVADVDVDALNRLRFGAASF